MRKLGEKYQVSVSNIAIRWAYQKGTIPIVGVTKSKQVQDLKKLFSFRLEEEEMHELEALADQTGLNLKTEWE